jgi:leucyl/phenylalanyl-tRNA--protein transferase
MAEAPGKTGAGATIEANVNVRGPFWLGSESGFPPPELADENGLLAVGGGLSSRRLLDAYRSGIFPWPLGSSSMPMLWFSPDPRFLLFPEELHVSRSLRAALRSDRFQLRVDWAFEAVIRGCAAAPRPEQEGTWISPEMIAAYVELHRLGHAHSFESWEGEVLVGGVYGIAMGRAFFAESMFYDEPNASKVALIGMVRTLGGRGYRFIDCQQETAHLARFGARAVAREEFLERLTRALQEEGDFPPRGSVGAR